MKFHKHQITIMAFLAAAAVFPALAQEKSFPSVEIAGGGGAKNGSTYSTMLGELASACSQEISIKERTTTGGVENLSLVKENQVPLAIVPFDLLVLAKRENATSVASIKTIVSMHQEEVHFVARSDEKVEGGRTILGRTFGGETVVFNRAEDLANRPVGAVGGAVKTAEILSDLLRLKFTVKPFPTNDALKSALEQGQVDAAIFVAGQPQSLVAKLSGDRFKLLPLRGNADTAAVYTATKLEYKNLNGGRPVDSVSSPALLVARTFRSKDMLNNLAVLRSCFLENLANIQDKPMTHPSWQTVKGEDKGRWEWYDLPNPSSSAAVSAPRAVSTETQEKVLGLKKK